MGQGGSRRSEPGADGLRLRPARQDAHDVEVTDTMAHELAHVAQTGVRRRETRRGVVDGEHGHFVAYKVMTALVISPRVGISPATGGALRRPAARIRRRCSTTCTGRSRTARYSGFLFFYYASQELGDGIVKQVWQEAAPRGAQASTPSIRPSHSWITFHGSQCGTGMRIWTRSVLYEDGDGTFHPP